jgi:hypothetical protein
MIGNGLEDERGYRWNVRIVNELRRITFMKGVNGR